MAQNIKAPTVGEILKEEFMEPLSISTYALAKAIFVPVSRIQEILKGNRKITVDTSLRLGKFLAYPKTISCLYKMKSTYEIPSTRLWLT